MAEFDWTRRAALGALLGGGALLGLSACGGSPRQHSAVFEPARFQTWTGGDPVYRLYPGDAIEVTVHTAPELSREIEIGPDGRANLPGGRRDGVAEDSPRGRPDHCRQLCQGLA